MSLSERVRVLGPNRQNYSSMDDMDDFPNVEEDRKGESKGDIVQHSLRAQC